MNSLVSLMSQVSAQPILALLAQQPQTPLTDSGEWIANVFFYLMGAVAILAGLMFTGQRSVFILTLAFGMFSALSIIKISRGYFLPIFLGVIVCILINRAFLAQLQTNLPGRIPDQTNAPYNGTKAQPLYR